MFNRSCPICGSNHLIKLEGQGSAFKNSYQCGQCGQISFKDTLLTTGLNLGIRVAMIVLGGASFLNKDKR